MVRQDQLAVIEVSGGRFRSTASFSRDRRYRYSLTRRWANGPSVAWVMLNPSTADAQHDDPTIRRCIDFSARWGFGALEVVNLSALRTPHPAVLRAAPEPIGPRNDRALQRALGRCDAVVAAWGNHGMIRGRSEQVHGRLPQGALALGLTRAGEPRHPLYVASACEPVLWSELACATPLR